MSRTRHVHFDYGDGTTRCGRAGLPLAGEEAEVTCGTCLRLLPVTRESIVHFDPDGSDLSVRCGHRGRVETASDEDAVTCLMCLNLMAGTHGVGNRRADLKPCGTLAAHRRHLRRGERVCESCRQASSRDSADRHRKAAEREARRSHKRKVLAA